MLILTLDFVLLPLAQQHLNLRQLRLHAMQVLLHVVNLLLGFVVNREVGNRLVLVSRSLPNLANYDD